MIAGSSWTGGLGTVGSARAVGRNSVFDSEHDHFVAVVIDAIQNAVRSASGSVDTAQFVA